MMIILNYLFIERRDIAKISDLLRDILKFVFGKDVEVSYCKRNFDINDDTNKCRKYALEGNEYFGFRNIDSLTEKINAFGGDIIKIKNIIVYLDSKNNENNLKNTKPKKFKLIKKNRKKSKLIKKNRKK